MKADKLHSLKQSLLYSYQAETIRRNDGREFKCLINPSKLTENYDWKVLSIPYFELAENSVIGRPEPVKLHCGDTFTWVENNTHWIVYLQHLEEEAYFRAEIRKCEYELVLENGSSYRIHWQGPNQGALSWNQKNDIVWNDLSNTCVFYIQDNEETRKSIKRFAIISIAGQNWEVQVVDKSQGLLKVTAKEAFTNQYEEIRKEAEEQAAEIQAIEEAERMSEDIYILGDVTVKPYSVHTYEIIGAEGGSWLSSNSKLTISAVDNNKVTVQVTTGRSGNADLIYRLKDDEIVLPIAIESL